MTSQNLFVNLVYRLARMPDAMVLYALLRRQADEEELATSKVRIANRLLEDQLTETQVKYSLKSLEKLGLVSSRVHQNYRTRVTVNREAVRELLSQPLAERLPGLQDEHFPFLDFLAGQDAAATAPTPSA